MRLEIKQEFSSPNKRRQFLRHQHEWKDCIKCMIGQIAHKHCFFRGGLPCQVLFIGEGPGKDEDAAGYPFVGDSGQMLEKWIKRGQEDRIRLAGGGLPVTYAITNTVLCRPTDKPGGPNRPPSSQEQLNCLPRFSHFLTIANPKAVVLIGRVAAIHWVEYIANGFKPDRGVVEVYHPGYIMRKGGEASAAFKESMEKIVKLFVSM